MLEEEPRQPNCFLGSAHTLYTSLRAALTSIHLVNGGSVTLITYSHRYPAQYKQGQTRKAQDKSWLRTETRTWNCRSRKMTKN